MVAPGHPNLTYFLAAQAAHFFALQAAHFLAAQAAHFFAAQAAHFLLAQVAAVRQRAPQPPLAQPASAEAVTTAVAKARERLEARELMVKSLKEWKQRENQGNGRNTGQGNRNGWAQGELVHSSFKVNQFCVAF